MSEKKLVQWLPSIFSFHSWLHFGPSSMFLPSRTASNPILRSWPLYTIFFEKLTLDWKLEIFSPLSVLFTNCEELVCYITSISVILCVPLRDQKEKSISFQMHSGHPREGQKRLGQEILRCKLWNSILLSILIYCSVICVWKSLWPFVTEYNVVKLVANTRQINKDWTKYLSFLQEVSSHFDFRILIQDHERHDAAVEIVSGDWRDVCFEWKREDRTTLSILLFTRLLLICFKWHYQCIFHQRAWYKGTSNFVPSWHMLES